MIVNAKTSWESETCKTDLHVICKLSMLRSKVGILFEIELPRIVESSSFFSLLLPIVTVTESICSSGQV